MAERTVFCSKLQREAPGLSEPPFGGDLGRQVYEHVSEEAWTQWKEDVMIKIINEYRLDMTNSEHYQMLLDQMSAFLNLNTETKPLEVENEARGRGEK